MADDASGIELIVTFFDGHPSLHAYLNRYRQYLRRPTSHVPPTPRDFPVVEIEVSASAGRKSADVQVLRPGSFRSSTEGLEVNGGLHSLKRNADHSLTLLLQHPHGQAELFFVPQGTPAPPEVSVQDGEYLFDSDPQCVVSGTLVLTPPAPLEPRTIQIAGRGSLEHRWCPKRTRADAGPLGVLR